MTKVEVSIFIVCLFMCFCWGWVVGRDSDIDGHTWERAKSICQGELHKVDALGNIVCLNGLKQKMEMSND